MVLQVNYKQTKDDGAFMQIWSQIEAFYWLSFKHQNMIQKYNP